jgi:hypothetical protein
METITIDRQFFDYLTSIQRNAGTPDGVASGMHLREISAIARANSHISIRIRLNYLPVFLTMCSTTRISPQK